MGVLENGGTPKSSILVGLSIVNHPFWGTPYFWKHPYGSKWYPSRIQQAFLPIRGSTIPPWHPHERKIAPSPNISQHAQLSFCSDFHSLTSLQGWHLCVQLLGASQDVFIGSKLWKLQEFTGFNWQLFTWSKPGNQSQAANISYSPNLQPNSSVSVLPKS